MNKKAIFIAYVKILAYDNWEARQIFYKLPRTYIVKRESGSCEVEVAGIKVASDDELKQAVSQFNQIISRVTDLSYSVLEYGTMKVRTCKRRLDNGKLIEDYGYVPSNAEIGDKVEVFSIWENGFVEYLCTGELVDFVDDTYIVTVPIRYMW